MYDKHISTKELLIHIGCCIVGAALVLGISYAINYSQLYDVEILNGQVTSKYNHKEFCTQSSSCKHYTWHEKCRTRYDSKGNPIVNVSPIRYLIIHTKLTGM
ncbi:UNVERIFIED_ORG: hypothetical protein [Escherichia phage CMSTMSU]